LRALLKRWQDSLDLHARYLALDDNRYQHIQPWPKHERPARWIIELAREKVRALSKLVEQRSKAGDHAFVEALELMGFLSTLVGLSSVERFIPLCDAANERRDVLNATPASEERTREMPQLAGGQIGRMLLAQQAGVPYSLAADARRGAARKRGADGGALVVKTARPAAARSAVSAAAKPAAPASVRLIGPTGVDAAVVEDAVRLLGWGRMWHELPEIIARLADRPSLTQLRRILREQRPLIERRHAAASR
jgi:hypothetical protein